eukprot:scaffold15892_cov58-Cyclotella_meneghiniana.AAC.5
MFTRQDSDGSSVQTGAVSFIPVFGANTDSNQSSLHVQYFTSRLIVNEHPIRVRILAHLVCEGHEKSSNNRDKSGKNNNTHFLDTYCT